MNEDMKDIRKMTDDEILNHLCVGIHDYMERIRPYREFVLEDCLSMEVEALKRLYRTSRGLPQTRRYKLSTDEIRELDALLTRLRPAMLAMTRPVQTHYMKQLAVWKVNGTAASALIVKAFADRGLSATVECQKHRAKVSVDLGKYHARLYVGYKSVARGDTVDGLVQATMDLRDALSRMGNDVKVGR